MSTCVHFCVGQEDGDEGPEAGLDIGDKEHEPVETPAAPRDGRSPQAAERVAAASEPFWLHDRRSHGFGAGGSRPAPRDGPREPRLAAATSEEPAAGALAPCAPMMTIGFALLVDRRLSQLVARQVGDQLVERPLSGKCSTCQSTAILRVPTPRNPPKSMMAARTMPLRSTMTSTTRPRSSPFALCTGLPRRVSAQLPSTTTAGVSVAAAGPTRPHRN